MPIHAPLIRCARHHELDQLTSLARRSKAHWGYGPVFMRACAAELTVMPAHLPHVYVVLSGGVIEGFQALSRLDADRAELEFLFVEPAALRKGHGRRLVEHAQALARSWGCRVIMIQGDPNALEFYRRVGAVWVGERESDSVPGRMLPLLELSVVRPPDGV